MLQMQKYKFFKRLKGLQTSFLISFKVLIITVINTYNYYFLILRKIQIMYINKLKIIALGLFSFFTHYIYAWNTPTLSSPSNGSGNWTGVTLDWNAVASSEKYELQLDTSASFNSPVIFSTVKTYINTSSSNNDTQHWIEDLYFGVTYYWRVRAWITGDTSAWSTTRTFYTYDYVNLSTPSTGSDNYTGVTLDWYSHAGVDFYDLQADTTPLFNSVAIKNYSKAYINTSSSNTDTEQWLDDLYFGKTYYWRVRARNAVDTSAWSTVWSFNTRDYVNMATPSTGSDNWTGLTLDWYAHNGIDFYDLQVDTTSSFNSSVLKSYSLAYINTSSSNTDTEQWLDDLYFGKIYYWRVRVRNAVDTSGWSSIWSFNTRDYVNLATPSSGSDNWTGLTLDWYAHNGIDYYDMQADTSTSFNSPALKSYNKAYINSSSSNTDTEQWLDDLYFGKTYYWRVRVRNAVDTSSWSTIWSFNTRDYINHATPSTGSDNYTGLTLDWYAHAGIDFYDLQTDTSGSFNSPVLKNFSKTYINSSSSNTDTEQWLDDLYFGKTYYWRVRARNAVDTSSWSTMWTFNTRDFVNLATPSSGSNNWTGLTLDWYVHSGVDFYDVQADTTPMFSSTALKSYSKTYINNSSSNTDTEQWLDNLYFGTTYYWRVRVRNAVDTSEWSNVWLFNTNNYVTLSSPSDGSLNTSTSGVVLNWNAHSGITQYQMQLDTTNIFNSPSLVNTFKNYINTSSSNSDTEQHTGVLLANTIYFWRVRPINAVDTGEWTVRCFSTGNNTILLPAVPILTSPTNGISGIGSNTTLIWNASANATSYEYIYSTSPSFSGAFIQTTTQTQVAISSLTTNVTYYWKVRAKNGSSIYSDWSNIWTFNTGNACTTYDIYENITVCYGDSYTFPDGFVQNNITTPMNHTSNLLTIYQCDSIIHTTINVNVIDVGVNINNNNLTANASGLIYQWVDCNNMFAPIQGATLQSFTPTTNGMYAVQITSGNCTQLSACYTITTVNSENIDAVDVFTIYPNPNNGTFNIDLGKEYSHLSIEIISMYGQMLYKKDYTSLKNITIDLDVPAGTYVLNVYNDVYFKSYRIMIH